MPNRRRVNGALNSAEQSIREEILAGLLADKGGEAQISTAMRVLAEIIASDVSLLVTFKAIEGIIQNNQKARQNPKALAQLDGYKRPLVGSLSANLLLGRADVCPDPFTSQRHKGLLPKCTFYLLNC